MALDQHGWRREFAKGSIEFIPCAKCVANEEATSTQYSSTTASKPHSTYARVRPALARISQRFELAPPLQISPSEVGGWTGGRSFTAIEFGDARPTTADAATSKLLSFAESRRAVKPRRTPSDLRPTSDERRARHPREVRPGAWDPIMRRPPEIGLVSHRDDETVFPAYAAREYSGWHAR